MVERRARIERSEELVGNGDGVVGDGWVTIMDERMSWGRCRHKGIGAKRRVVAEALMALADRYPKRKPRMKPVLCINLSSACKCSLR